MSFEVSSSAAAVNWQQVDRCGKHPFVWVIRGDHRHCRGDMGSCADENGELGA